MLFTCDATKIGPGGSPSCPNFSLLGSQLVRKNDNRYYAFKYIFLNEQTFRLMKMINFLSYKSTQVILGVSRDLLKVF